MEIKSTNSDSQEFSGSGEKSPPSAIWGMFVFAGVFLLYALTLAPTAMWGDSAKLAMFAASPPVNANAGNHPLHNYIGYLFSNLPFGTLALKINLMSAFFGALAAALVFLISLRLSGSVFASIIGAASLALSHIFWFVSVQAESYTLEIFLLMLAVLLLLNFDERRKTGFLAGAFLMLGLACSVNLVTLFAGVGVLAFFIARRFAGITVKNALIALGAFVLGLCALVPGIVVTLSTPGEKDIIAQVFDLRYSGTLFIYDPAGAAKGLALYFPILFYQFPLVVFVAGFIGLAVLWKTRRAAAVMFAASVLSVAVFTSTYMLQRRFSIMSVSFAFFALFIAAGIAAAMKKIKSPRGAKIFMACVFSAAAALPVITYIAAPRILASSGINPVKIRELPYRDPVKFYFTPWKTGEWGPKKYAGAALRTAAGGVIISDFTPYMALKYFQSCEGMGADVRIVFSEGINLADYIRKNGSKERLFIVDGLFVKQIPGWEKICSVKKSGVLYEISPMVKQ